MGNIKNSTDLQKAIVALELQNKIKSELVKEQFLIIHESLKPINLLKSTIKDIISSPDLKTGIIDISIGVSTGFMAKKIVAGDSHNVFKQLMGSAVQMIVTKEVTKNADSILVAGRNFISRLIKTNN